MNVAVAMFHSSWIRALFKNQKILRLVLAQELPAMSLKVAVVMFYLSPRSRSLFDNQITLCLVHLSSEFMSSSQSILQRPFSVLGLGLETPITAAAYLVLR